MKGSSGLLVLWPDDTIHSCLPCPAYQYAKQPSAQGSTTKDVFLCSRNLNAPFLLLGELINVSTSYLRVYGTLGTTDERVNFLLLP